MTFQLSHLQAMFLFALGISIAFGFLSRRPPLERLKYVGWSLLLFLLSGIELAQCCVPVCLERIGHEAMIGIAAQKPPPFELRGMT